jgi:phage terminase large subunit GpA-like protein
MKHGALLRLVALAALYVAAAPTFVFLWIRRALRAFRASHLVRGGFVDCPHCGARNPLDILATCRRCGATEFGSRLYCGHCGDVTEGFGCDHCTATITVL